MVSCEIVIGLTWTPLVGEYLPSSMLEHLPDLEEAINHFRDPIVPGYLDVDLEETSILWNQHVLDLLAE